MINPDGICWLTKEDIERFKLNDVWVHILGKIGPGTDIRMYREDKLIAQARRVENGRLVWEDH